MHEKAMIMSCPKELFLDSHPIQDPKRPQIGTLFSWDLDDRHAGGVSDDCDRARKHLAGALLTKRGGGSGAVRQARIDIWTRSALYEYGPPLVVARLDAVSGEIAWTGPVIENPAIAGVGDDSGSV